jgi:hypothetical protein
MGVLQLQNAALVETLHQIAEHEQTSPEDLLEQAATEFLERVALKKMQAETSAFERIHPQLVEQYLGQHVAVHNGMMIDHDPDLRTLHIRIRKRFGKVPILLRQVTEDPSLPELVVRSPKLSRVA